jgi:signal peptidase II
VQAAPGTPLSLRDPGIAAPAARPGRRRVTVLAAVAALVLAADIVSKALVVAHLRPDQPVHLIGDVLMLWLTRNPGAAFSVGTGETIVFTVIAFGVVVYIARTARKLYSLGWAIALGLLLGGAMGNLGDRVFRAPGLFRGDVVDWIAVTRYYPIFNLADSAIVCGGILTVILALRGYHLDGTRTESPGQASASDQPRPEQAPSEQAPSEQAQSRQAQSRQAQSRQAPSPQTQPQAVQPSPSAPPAEP